MNSLSPLKGWALLALLLTPPLALPAARAQSAALPCGGRIAARTINGDVEVPRGRTCTLVNTRVNGDVRVERGARLTVQNTRIVGDLETDEGFTRLTVRSSVVTGDLKAEEGGSVDVQDVRVGGDLKLERNRGTLRLSRVTVRGDLECEGNARAPTGGRVGVNGEQTGQCRDL